MDPSSRRTLVRERIAAGVLPATPCAEVWGGRGTGSTCAGCDRTISAPEFEFECHDEARCVFTVCRPCLYIWDSLIRAAERLVG